MTVRQKLPRTVVVLGLVSFFNDLASDMVIPLIPILLVTQLGAGPIALGLIEGVADAIAAFLKLWSGRHSDLLGGRRKTLTAIGYTLSNIARPLLAMTATWAQLLVLRSIDRVGKGIRSAPRDALVMDVTPPAMLGAAFGLHRALDNAGAVGGALTAAAILAFWQVSLQKVVLWSCVPGIIGVLLVLLAIEEARRPLHLANNTLPKLAWNALTAPLKRYLLLIGLFTFARASETFIVLKGREIGLSVVHLLVLWSALNLAKALTASWGGRLADRVEKTLVLKISWSAFALCLLGFGFAANALWLWIATLVYGAIAGMSEGGERALIGAFAAVNERGTAFGWYNMMLGLAAIPAGLAFGALWQFGHAGWAFGFAALVAAASAFYLHRWMIEMRSMQAKKM
jgi:MFS family permease